MNDPTVAAGILVTLIGTGVLLGGIFYGLAFWAKKKRLKIGLGIMNNGGPKTKEEYFFLFPDACKECGSRVIYAEEICTTYPSDISGVIGYDIFTSRKCEREHAIGHVGIYTGTGGYPEDSKTKQEVHSHYLTREQEANIPQEIPQKVGTEP